MTTQTDLTDAQCDAIVETLNAWAKSIDNYEYGLPMYKDHADVIWRALIRDALRRTPNETKAVEP